MVEDGIISKYAVCGAVAATFYIEPVQTYDLDIFIVIPAEKTGLITLKPIYSYLSEKGYKPDGECIEIEGWPVQFLPVFNPLTEEALDHSKETKFGSTQTWIISAEYLAAIMLDIGRPKDLIRLSVFLENKILDLPVFNDILERFNICNKFESFLAKFPRKD